MGYCVKNQNDFPSKNRVWDFFSRGECYAGDFQLQVVEVHQEKEGVGTMIASGRVEHYQYDPFGNITHLKDFDTSGVVNDNPFRFSTKFTDDETDLVYYGYRFYNPKLGRWLNRDPIEEKGGINLYGFTYQSPINNFDVLGLTIRDSLACYGEGTRYASDLGSELPGDCSCNAVSSTFAGHHKAARSWHACTAATSDEDCDGICDYEVRVVTGHWNEWEWWNCEVEIQCDCVYEGEWVSFTTSFSDAGEHGSQNGYTIDTDDTYTGTIPCDDDIWSVHACPEGYDAPPPSDL